MTATTDDGRYLADSRQDLLPKASIGRSCIRFKRLGDVDQGVIAGILREAQTWRPPS